MAATWRGETQASAPPDAYTTHRKTYGHATLNCMCHRRRTYSRALITDGPPGTAGGGADSTMASLAHGTFKDPTKHTPRV